MDQMARETRAILVSVGWLREGSTKNVAAKLPNVARGFLRGNFADLNTRELPNGLRDQIGGKKQR